MKKKGFTFIELIIALAIIAVLTAMVSLAWVSMLQRSRTRSLDKKAKTVFNAAQTAATEMMSYERTHGNAYMGTGGFYYYWDGNTGGKVDASGSFVGGFDEQDRMFGRSINRILEDDIAYIVYVDDNYKVQSVATSRNSTDRYIGAYPVTLNASGSTYNSFTALTSAIGNVNDFQLP